MNQYYDGQTCMQIKVCPNAVFFKAFRWIQFTASIQGFNTNINSLVYKIKFMKSHEIGFISPLIQHSKTFKLMHMCTYSSGTYSKCKDISDWGDRDRDTCMLQGHSHSLLNRLGHHCWGQVLVCSHHNKQIIYPNTWKQHGLIT